MEIIVGSFWDLEWSRESNASFRPYGWYVGVKSHLSKRQKLSSTFPILYKPNNIIVHHKTSNHSHLFPGFIYYISILDVHIALCHHEFLFFPLQSHIDRKSPCAWSTCILSLWRISLGAISRCMRSSCTPGEKMRLRFKIGRMSSAESPKKDTRRFETPVVWLKKGVMDGCGWTRIALIKRARQSWARQSTLCSLGINARWCVLSTLRIITSAADAFQTSLRNHDVSLEAWCSRSFSRLPTCYSTTVPGFPWEINARCAT